MEKENIYDINKEAYNLFVITASEKELRSVLDLLEKKEYDKASRIVSEYAKNFNTEKDFKDIEEPSGGDKHLKEEPLVVSVDGKEYEFIDERAYCMFLILQIADMQMKEKNEEEYRLRDQELESLRRFYYGDNETGFRR